jgi:hypothetical protein
VIFLLELSNIQRNKIGEYISGFKRFLVTDSGAKWQQEREERQRLFSRLLDRSTIDDLSSDNFAIIVKSLWATRTWTNKDYKANQVVTENGIERIRVELKSLIYGEGPVATRYDRFRANVKGLGPSSITEILVFVAPERYSLWNEKPKDVLPFLGMSDLLPERVYKYSISGEEYEKCNEVLDLVKKELGKRGINDPDFIDVDFFLAYIFYEVIPREEPTETQPVTREKEPYQRPNIQIETHPHAETLLLELGNMLGFDTYTSDPSKSHNGTPLSQIAKLNEMPQFTHKKILETAREIDVIWFRDEFPAYCFEVEHTTNVKDGLLRLYQVRHLNAKFYIVAPHEVETKFLTEVAKDPFNQISSRYKFKSYEDLSLMHQIAKEYYQIKSQFGIE